MKKNILVLLLLASLSIVSCTKEYLETAPTSSVAEADLFKTLTGAQTLLEGIHRFGYVYGGAHDKFGHKAIDYAMECLGEDFYPTERGYGWFVSWYQYLEHRNVNSANCLYPWDFYYDIINNANLLLSNIDNITVFDSEVPRRNNIKAQALVYRAHSHYQLIQMYAERYNFVTKSNTQLGIPIRITPGQEPLARATVEAVYTQIKKDLTDAITLLTGNTASRLNMSHIHFNTANAIAARVALTTGDWANAVTYARAARTGTTLEANYNYGFNKISTEWIWGAVLIDEQQTSYASFFSHIDPAFQGYATLGNHKLLSTVVFDFMSATDTRKVAFKTTSGKPRVGWKFTGAGGWTNDYLYIKAGEMFLIEAEAEARRNNFTDAQNVLFTLINKRDPGYAKTTLTGDALINHIIMHRRADLWGEGQRFFDIKRLNNGLDRRDLGHNPAQWNAASHFAAGDKNFVFLIPQQEMDANPLMVQNPL